MELQQETGSYKLEDSLAFGIYFRQIESPGLKKLQKKDLGFLFQVGGIQSTGVLPYCFIFFFLFFLCLAVLLRGCSTSNGQWGKNDDGKVFETCFKSQVSSQVTQLSLCHKRVKSSAAL